MQIDSIKDTGKSSRTLADFEKIQESPSIESVLKMSAKSAACAPCARVRVHGLQTKTEFNNCLGTVKGAVDGGRFCVLLDGEAGRELSLKPENFSLEAEEGKVVAAVAEEEAVEPEGPLAPKPLPKPLPSLPSSTLPAHPLPAAGEEEEEEEEVAEVV